MRAISILITLAAALTPAIPVRATPLSIEAFAARPAVEGASISPDGRYVSMIRTQAGHAAVIVHDLQGRADATNNVVMGEPEKFYFRWCRFATNTRLLCSFGATTTEQGVTYGVTRLVAVDADGKNMKVLVQNSGMAQGQYLDRILHWHPGPPDTVLIEADEGYEVGNPNAGAGVAVIGNVGTHAQPAVFELNIKSGYMKIRQRSRSPIRTWIADPKGEVRLGYGISGTMESYYARLEGEKEWRRLVKFEAFSRDRVFEPIAIVADEPNKAYAFADAEGRQALWKIDLTDKTDPELIFSHPAVAVDLPLLSWDGRLLGIRYETENPNEHYTDARAAGVIAAFTKAHPNTFNMIDGASHDDTKYVIESYSDVSPPTYSLFDVSTGQILRLSEPAADLPPVSLARMKAISYPARDGVEVPGYLTVPRGAAAKNLPMIVMPHGGPIARDRWDYFFLREFLASRGYAVLQMNFRGSGGYSDDWFFSAHQDWGGLTYDDVVDGTRWAISSGTADPNRICIVGWSFGGYMALVGAQRNHDLFKCSVSIAGVSDLSMLVDEAHRYVDARIVAREIGTDREKLRRDSPRLHVREIEMPVLMLHGTLDANVPFEQSNAMDRALTAEHKPHRFVVIPNADHSLRGDANRATLLKEVETFLTEHLPVDRPPVQ